MDPLAKASLASTVAPAGRAAFLAGFTYYEMGRYAFYGTGRTEDWSVHYIRALCGAFVMAVLSVSISSMYGRYLLTLRLPRAQRGYALGARNWARAVAYFFFLSYLCLAIAQMFLGYVYFPTNCGASVTTCKKAAAAITPSNATNSGSSRVCRREDPVDCGGSAALELAGCTPTAYALVPFVGGMIMLIGIVMLFLKISIGFYNSGGVIVDAHGRAGGNEINKSGSIVKRNESSGGSSKTRNTKELELFVRTIETCSKQVTNPAHESLVAGGKVYDISAAPATSAATSNSTTVATPTTPTSPTTPTTVAMGGPCSQENRRHHRPERMYNMIHPIADQATFVASFALAAQTRLLANIDGDGSDRTLTFLYIVLMTTASVSSILSSLGLSFIDMLLVDMRNGGIAGTKEQNHFLDVVSNVVHGCFLLFAVACVSFLGGFCVMAWGVGYMAKSVRLYMYTFVLIMKYDLCLHVSFVAY